MKRYAGSIAFAALVAATALAQQPTSPAGRWQYLQPPDKQGEVLDLSQAAGRWRGVFNGLEGGDLVLRCEDKDHSCPDAVLRFKKIAN